MSNIPQSTSATSSAEERQRRIEEETSVGKYTMKQVKQEGILLLGAVVGYFAGKGLVKNKRIAGWAEGKAASLVHMFKGVNPATTEMFIKDDTVHITTASQSLTKKTNLGELLFSLGGVFVGSTLSGIVNMYEHWKNVEGEKLAVSEINHDVGNPVNERTRFAETLNRQENLVKDLVAKGQIKGNFTERSVTPEATADIVRG